MKSYSAVLVSDKISIDPEEVDMDLPHQSHGDLHGSCCGKRPNSETYLVREFMGVQGLFDGQEATEAHSCAYVDDVLVLRLNSCYPGTWVQC